MSCGLFRARIIATSGPVSATARLLMSEAFHVLRVGAEVGRRAGRALDAPDQARPGRHVEGGFFGRLYSPPRSGGQGSRHFAVQLAAERGELLRRQSIEAGEKMVEFTVR